MTATHRHRVSHGSIAIAAMSTVVEWYDFTLYLYFATVLSRVFFGGGAGSLGTTLAGFAIAYLMRPLGAAVFGHVGDKHGRRTMLLWSMALMSAAMLATALLPTRAAIGPAAGWLMLALRCVMGFAVGGEYSGVVAYLLEGAAPRRRGLVASSASAASEVGGLLAAGVSALTVALLSEADLAAWGWRIPFLTGAALAIVVFIARSTMEESPDFERQRATGTVPDQPWKHSLTNHRGAIARAFAISALGSITYYVGITYVPAYLTSIGSMNEKQSLWLSTIAAVVVIAVTPLTGILTDRIGRRPVLVAIAVLSMVLPITLFTWMASASWSHALAGALLLAAVAGAMSAVGAVATAEQFPGEGRVSGLAFGATGATAIFGGFTPWIAHWLTGLTGIASIPGLMIALVALAVLPLFWRMRETAPTSDA